MGNKLIPDDSLGLLDAYSSLLLIFKMEKTRDEVISRIEIKNIVPISLFIFLFQSKYYVYNSYSSVFNKTQDSQQNIQ